MMANAPAPTGLAMPVDPRRLLCCLDLTILDEDASPATMDVLCARAGTELGPVAAVCVYPEYVDRCRRNLLAAGRRTIKVATVTNFPDGGDDIDRAERETRRALAAGADEIDVVFPWRALLAGAEKVGFDLVRRCADLCHPRARLKVILETGQLVQPERIARASTIAIEAGADFIKTSTGKVAVNATVEAARVMLETIRSLGGHCGFKAAGGIRTRDGAALYLQLAEQVLGPGWACPARFRIGSSSLYDDLLTALGG